MRLFIRQEQEGSNIINPEQCQNCASFYSMIYRTPYPDMGALMFNGFEDF